MASAYRNRLVTALALTCIPLSLLAGPKIAVDTADYNIGTFHEGQAPTIYHKFTIKNTGDSVLVLKQVRAGCGCTTVGVDSVIAPGKEGRLTAEITTTGMAEGDFRKTITVTSNATNSPTLQLAISGKYITILNLEQRESIRLSGVKGSDTGGVVHIKSSRPLKIEKAEFKFKEGSQGMDWEVAIPIKFTIALIDSPKVSTAKPAKKPSQDLMAKPFVYQVRLFFNPKLTEDKWGDFCLTTDLKEKKEIKFPGMLEGKK